MIFNDYDKNYLLKNFPKIELFYEKVGHNKVSTDYCMAIPQGRKYFAWFTCIKNKFVCVLLELGFNSKVIGVRFYNCCFKNELSYGTIFYGTFIERRFFFIEDIFYYKGNNVKIYNNLKKINLIKEIFENELKQISYSSHDIIFGLPVMKTSYNDMYNEMLNIPYKIYCVQFRNMNNDYRSNYLMKNEKISKAIFLIKATIQNDIYDLFYHHDKRGIIKYGIPRIPNYETSIMMNNLFRTIKENNNLDKLEESDDEDEFENIELDKYVDLKKRVKMECVYNHKFQKWIPLKVCKDNNVKIVSSLEIKQLEK